MINNVRIMTIVEKSSAYVQKLLNDKLSPKNIYHNLQHTERVVKKTQELADWEKVGDVEKQWLAVAAWFHDTGYVMQDHDNEQIGADEAESFLREEHADEEMITAVKRLILVTKSNAEPKDLLEKIMKDADCSHLGAPYYDQIAGFLKQELEYTKGEKIPELFWAKNNVAFMKDHTFYTDAAKALWQAQKDINIFHLEQQIAKKVKKKKDKNMQTQGSKKLGRGVETMFRVTLSNHIELSAIADTKANILLSVNAIIISVAIANLLPKLDAPTNSFLVYPTMVLLLFSVISVVLSVLSTRPKISNVNVTQEMIKKNQTNILFFGNFHKMKLEEFEWGIDYLIEHEDSLYNSLTKDLYFLGLVLERKYRLLRITYNVFMIGIVLSALAFVISYFLIAEVA